MYKASPTLGLFISKFSFSCISLRCFTRPEERYDMPLYEYECTQCQRRTEKIQKFSDPEITECPHCEGLLERVISAPAISFKGGGWFADGYGNAKPKSSGDGATASSKSGGATGSSSEAAGSPSKDTTTAPASSGTSSPAAPAAAAPSTSSSDKK